MTTRILIIDNHPIMRHGLKSALQVHPAFIVEGEASCCQSGCTGISSLRPDLVVFDIELADACGTDMIARFRDKFPDMPAVIFTREGSREIVAEALRSGIQGFVLKCSPSDRIIRAIESVAAGGPYLDPALGSVLFAEMNSVDETPAASALSDRQLLVLRMLAEGKANKEIARDLFISESTVKFHVSAILQLLKARNRTHAARIAEEQGWIKPRSTGRSIAPAGVDPVRVVAARLRDSR
ncbi:MAG: response regulator transcription factor [Chromatiales bacterium]|jgi:DNA-binding NarL/FixJ family response regulator